MIIKMAWLVDNNKKNCLIFGMVGSVYIYIQILRVYIVRNVKYESFIFMYSIYIQKIILLYSSQTLVLYSFEISRENSREKINLFFLLFEKFFNLNK